MKPPIFTGNSAKTALIVDEFALTSSARSRFASGVFHLLSAEKHSITTASTVRGALSDVAISADVPCPTARLSVVTLRTLVAGLAGSRGVRKAWCRFWRAAGVLSHCAKHSERAVFVLNRGLWFSTAGLGLVGWALALRVVYARRLRLTQFSRGPKRAIEILTGQCCDKPDPATADEAVFAHFSDRQPNALRITRGHIVRAMDCAGLPLGAPLRADLARVAAIADTLDPCAVLEPWIAEPSGSDMPPAIAAAYKVGPGGQTRLAVHLGLIRSAADRAAARPLVENLLGFRIAPRSKTWVPASVPSKDLGIAAAFASGAASNDRFLDAPLAGQPGNISRRTLMALLLFRPPLRSLEDFRAPWRSADLTAWCTETLGPVTPAFAATGAPVIEVSGPVHAATGLGQNLAMSVTALRGAGLPVTVCPVPKDAASRLQPTRALRRRITRPVALHHMNADRIPQLIAGRYRASAAYHIGYLLWEFDRLPKAHRLALEMLDEVWVPSRFLADTYSAATDRPVLCMRKSIALPAPVLTARHPDQFTYLIAFDFHSSVERKNPLAAVQGFLRAFPKDKDVRLVIKTTPPRAGHWGDPDDQMGAIRALVASDPRLTLNEAQLPFAELIGLIASADALISTHRAEGFGYLPAYALALGVPVITTDWSGTRDFCTPRTSCPLPAALVPVPEGKCIYPTPGARWAEIDAEALVEALRAHRQDPDELRQRASQGQMLIRSVYSPEALEKRYLDRLTTLGLVEPERTQSKDLTSCSPNVQNMPWTRSQPKANVSHAASADIWQRMISSR